MTPSCSGVLLGELEAFVLGRLGQGLGRGVLVGLQFAPFLPCCLLGCSNDG